jgi:hypothetical protein
MADILVTPHALVSDSAQSLLMLRETGLDAGADAIRWHLEHRHQVRVSRATISRILVRTGLVTPELAKRPTWQSDFTHYRLTRPDGRPGADVEVLSWLDDHARYAPAGVRTSPGHRTERARHLPRNRSSARHPRIHADRQRHGLPDPVPPVAAAAEPASKPSYAA